MKKTITLLMLLMTFVVGAYAQEYGGDTPTIGFKWECDQLNFNLHQNRSVSLYTTEEIENWNPTITYSEAGVCDKSKWVTGPSPSGDEEYPVEYCIIFSAKGEGETIAHITFSDHPELNHDVAITVTKPDLTVECVNTEQTEIITKRFGIPVISNISLINSNVSKKVNIYPEGIIYLQWTDKEEEQEDGSFKYSFIFDAHAIGETDVTISFPDYNDIPDFTVHVTVTSPDLRIYEKQESLEVPCKFVDSVVLHTNWDDWKAIYNVEIEDETIAKYNGMSYEFVDGERRDALKFKGVASGETVAHVKFLYNPELDYDIALNVTENPIVPEVSGLAESIIIDRNQVAEYQFYISNVEIDKLHVNVTTDNKMVAYYQGLKGDKGEDNMNPVFITLGNYDEVGSTTIHVNFIDFPELDFDFDVYINTPELELYDIPTETIEIEPDYDFVIEFNSNMQLTDTSVYVTHDNEDAVFYIRLESLEIGDCLYKNIFYFNSLYVGHANVRFDFPEYPDKAFDVPVKIAQKMPVLTAETTAYKALPETWHGAALKFISNVDLYHYNYIVTSDNEEVAVYDWMDSNWTEEGIEYTVYVNTQSGGPANISVTFDEFPDAGIRFYLAVDYWPIQGIKSSVDEITIKEKEFSDFNVTTAPLRYELWQQLTDIEGNYVSTWGEDKSIECQQTNWLEDGYGFRVLGYKSGSYILKLWNERDPEIYLEIPVTILAKDEVPTPQEAEHIMYTRIEEGQSFALELSQHDSGCHADAVWQSSDPEVAEVDETGKVTAISAGEAIITATCQGHTTMHGVYVDVETGVQAVAARNVSVYSQGMEVMVVGLEKDEKAEVFATDGTLVTTRKCEGTTLRMNVGTEGIYVVRAAGQSFKIIL